VSRGIIVCLGIAAVVFTQCGVTREIVKDEPAPMTGMEGLRKVCESKDTIRNILISKAETVISWEDERYETTVTLYAVKDSMIYLSAVNSGFEMIRAKADHDSIMVIDRLNRIVYSTPVKRKFGYQHPVNFEDLQNILTNYFLCDHLELAIDEGYSQIEFVFDENPVKKSISIDRQSLKMIRFEFFHPQTREYLSGEKTGEGFKIYSNFMISDFEIMARDGAISYNQELEVKMDINPKKYSFINL
jgi:hypothetical protein